MSARDVALDHYEQRVRLVEAAARVAERAWLQVDPEDILRSWLTQLPDLVAVVSTAQVGAARAADPYLDEVLDGQGLDATTTGTVVPRAFAGVASDGRSLATLLANPAIATLSAIKDGADIARALATGHATLDMAVRTQVADAGRAADRVAMTARPSVTGYARVAVGKTCARCLILAGRTYRWSDGFDRHPRCDCVHLPTDLAEAHNLVQDPQAIYDELTPQERTRAGFTKADQAAIAAGADLNAVVNARRGLYTTTVGGRRVQATREGTTVRGLFGGFEIDPDTGKLRARAGTELERRRSGSRRIRAARAPRLTTDQIYAIAGDDRDEAVRLLRRNGYLLGSVRSVPDAARPIARAAASQSMDLASLTVPQLRALAKERGITGLSRARRSDIIAALGGPAKATGLDTMTVVQLRAEARRLGVKIPSGSRKADIVKLLGGKQATAKAAVKTAAKLEDLTVAQLRALAKDRGITIPSGLRKADVVAHLRSWETAHGRSALTGEKLVRPSAAPKPTVPAKPSAPVQTGPVFTSSRSDWWNDLADDTGLDRPRPVRDLLVLRSSEGDYFVSGSVWRINGRAFLVEHSATGGPELDRELRAAREVVEQLLQFVDELPDSRASIQRAFIWARGTNPADGYWEQTYNIPGFRSLAVAGDGRTIVWGRSITDRPRGIFGSLKHEFGHNVDGYARSLGIDSRSPDWSAAARGDAATAGQVTDFQPTNAMAAGHPIALQPNPAKGYPYGVSTYGKSSPAEDWAESTRMYLLGQIGTGRLRPGGPVVPLYFRDIFPARAAILDRIFPDVAAVQRRR